jgi:hypothetical protein
MLPQVPSVVPVVEFKIERAIHNNNRFFFEKLDDDMSNSFGHTQMLLHLEVPFSTLLQVIDYYVFAVPTIVSLEFDLPRNNRTKLD